MASTTKVNQDQYYWLVATARGDKIIWINLWIIIRVK